MEKKNNHLGRGQRRWGRRRGAQRWPEMSQKRQLEESSGSRAEAWGPLAQPNLGLGARRRPTATGSPSIRWSLPSARWSRRWCRKAALKSCSWLLSPSSEEWWGSLWNLLSYFPFLTHVSWIYRKIWLFGIWCACFICIPFCSVGLRVMFVANVAFILFIHNFIESFICIWCSWHS